MSLVLPHLGMGEIKVKFSSLLPLKYESSKRFVCEMLFSEASVLAVKGLSQLFAAATSAA